MRVMPNTTLHVAQVVLFFFLPNSYCSFITPWSTLLSCLVSECIKVIEIMVEVA